MYPTVRAFGSVSATAIVGAPGICLGAARLVDADTRPDHAIDIVRKDAAFHMVDGNEANNADKSQHPKPARVVS
jgi:hypothetical protein